MLPNANKQTIELVHKEGLKILRKKKDVMEKTALYETIAENLKSKEELSLAYIDSILDLFEDIVA